MIGMEQHRKGFWGVWQNSISGLDWWSPYNYQVLHHNIGEDMQVANSILKYFLLSKKNQFVSPAVCKVEQGSPE